MSIAVIYDDGNPNFVYYGNQWTHQTNVANLYEDTVSNCDTTFHNSSTSRASFTAYFRGTDLSIYGPADAGVAFNYTMDSSDVLPAQINADAIGKRGGKIWGLVGLDNTTLHNFEFFPSAGVFKFDYLTFTPTEFTTIATSNVTLDDSDDSIKFSSGWTASSSGSYGDVIPFNGTVTSTSTAGSTMNFTFYGTSISVYGLLNQNSGKLSASFSIDGQSAGVYSPFDGSQPVSASQWTPNQLFFYKPNLLELGYHTLSVKVDEVTGSQALYIDSLVFTATASTPFNKADADAKAKAANTTSTTTPGFPKSSNNNDSPGGISAGAYAGIAIGAFVFFFIFYWLRRRIWVCINPAPAAPRVQNNTNPPPPKAAAPPCPRHAPHSGPNLSSIENGAAPPFNAPSSSPTYNPPPTFPEPQMEMRNTNPSSMPTPFISVSGPSPQRDLVDVRAPVSFEPQFQDGSDSSVPQPAPSVPLASPATSDGREGIAMPTTIQQPPMGPSASETQETTTRDYYLPQLS